MRRITGGRHPLERAGTEDALALGLCRAGRQRTAGATTRAAALLEAASAVFAERGYDQATMIEIAARSATAIGSLYRFFPTKEALGETLLRRFIVRSKADHDLELISEHGCAAGI